MYQNECRWKYGVLVAVRPASIRAPIHPSVAHTDMCNELVLGISTDRPETFWNRSKIYCTSAFDRPRSSGLVSGVFEHSPIPTAFHIFILCFISKYIDDFFNLFEHPICICMICNYGGFTDLWEPGHSWSMVCEWFQIQSEFIYYTNATDTQVWFSTHILA